MSKVFSSLVVRKYTVFFSVLPLVSLMLWKGLRSNRENFADNCARRFMPLRERESSVFSIVERINTSAQLQHPYGHVVIANFLPSDLLACVNYCFPAYERWLKVKNNRGKERKTIGLEFGSFTAPAWLKEKALSLFTPAESIFWESYNSIISHPLVTFAWVKKFEVVLKKRNFIKQNELNFTKMIHTGTIFPQYNLQLDSSRYAIKPHNDGGTTKVITILLYLPRQSESHSEHAGTLVLEEKLRRSVSSGIEYYDKTTDTVRVLDNTGDGDAGEKLYVVRGKGEYRSNSLLAFGICDKSWHAVPEQRMKERLLVSGFIIFSEEYITTTPGRC